MKQDFEFEDYDPAEEFRVVNFKQGPSGFYIPENDFTSEEIFDFTQLYLIFTDIQANLPLHQSMKTGEKKPYHSIEDEALAKVFNFRVKNIDVGFVKYVPDFWLDAFENKSLTVKFLDRFVQLSQKYRSVVEERIAREEAEEQEELMDAADELEFEDEKPIEEEAEDGEAGEEEGKSLVYSFSRRCTRGGSRSGGGKRG